MSQNGYAIYTEDLIKDEEIISTLANKIKKHHDLIIICDSNENKKLQSYAIFSSFYLRFFKGSIIFLNMEDYLTYQHTMLGKPLLFANNNYKNLDRSIIHPNNIIGDYNDI